MELTKHNYLYGTGSGSTWNVNIDPPKRKVKSYYEETIEAVEYVYANKVGKLQVLYSGGLDSQYVCEVLLKLGIKFETIIIELKDSNGNSYNDHDTKWAYEFCHAKNLKPTVYDLDFDNFVKTGKNVEIAESVECCAASIPHTLYALSQLDGFTILGNDPPYLRYEKEKDQWSLEELQYIHAILRFYKKNNLNGCPFLLSYTPEMMLSFLLDPAIVKLGTGQIPGKLGSNSTKSYVFNNGSNFNLPVYDFVTKTRVKQTGFEKIVDSPIYQHPNLTIFKNFWEIWNGEYLEPYGDAVKRLSVHQ
jgi:hypothetical protein